MKGLVTTPQRSKLMASVRQRGSAPELAVRAVLRGQGHRFKTNANKLPGSPDIYAPQERLAVFIHGCFWHRHRGCRACTTPKEHRDFWLEKFRQNVARDNRKVRELRRLGYRVLTVWECQVKSVSELARLKRRLDRFFGGKRWASSLPPLGRKALKQELPISRI
jgi:DNA mismatch endonuclease (patch repair protein)